MKTMPRIGLLSLLLLLAGVAHAVAADELHWYTPQEFAQNADLYAQGVESLRLELLSLPPDLDGSAATVAYLVACEDFAQTLIRWRQAAGSEGPVGLPPVAHIIQEREKLMELDDLDAEVVKAIRGERALHTKHITPLLNPIYVANLATRRAVLEIKYFDPDTDETGNIFEGYINSSLPFLKSTRLTEMGNDSWYRLHGVSKWEATLRTDPIVLGNDDNDAGALLALGALFNFFPHVNENPENPFDPDIEPTWASEHLKRMGLKLGWGFQVPEGGRPRALYGAGWQVRALTAWAVYSTRDDEWTWAGGLSDLGWLKGLIPVF